MKTLTAVLVSLMLSLLVASSQSFTNDWISLFDGKTLNGWKANENKTVFSVKDGMLIANGSKSHLFYNGSFQNADFKNFEFKVDVKTEAESNSGVFFHTAFQENGNLTKGYEVQIDNNSESDYILTGSLYGFVNIEDEYVKNGEWFTIYISVKGNHVMAKINDKQVLDYTETKEKLNPKNPDQKLSSGTFALQGYNGIIYFKNILVKPLP